MLLKAGLKAAVRKHSGKTRLMLSVVSAPVVNCMGFALMHQSEILARKESYFLAVGCGRMAPASGLVCGIRLTRVMFIVQARPVS